MGVKKYIHVCSTELSRYVISDLANIIIGYVTPRYPSDYEIGLYGVLEAQGQVQDHARLVIGAAEGGNTKLFPKICNDSVYKRELIEGSYRAGDNSYKPYDDRSARSAIRGAAYSGSLIKFEGYGRNLCAQLHGAIQARRLNLIQKLCSENEKIYLCNKLLSDMGKTGSREIINMVLRNKKPDAQKARIILSGLCDGNHTEMIKEMLGNGVSLTSGAIRKIYRDANPDVLAMLKFPPKLIKYAFNGACEGQQWELAKQLLQHFDGCCVGVGYAAYYNRTDIIDHILTYICKKKDVKYSHKDSIKYSDNVYCIDYLLGGAVNGDNIDLVHKILDAIPSHYISSEAVGKLCELDDISVIRHVIHDKCSADRFAYVIYSSNNPEFARHVLSMGGTPDAFYPEYTNEIIDVLLDGGMNPDYLLYEARSSLTLVKKAVEHGANPNMGMLHNPPLQVLKYLVSKGADPYYVLYNRPATVEICKFLINAGVDPNHLVMAKCVKSEVAIYLLNRGASPQLVLHHNMEDEKTVDHIISKLDDAASSYKLNTLFSLSSRMDRESNNQEYLSECVRVAKLLVDRGCTTDEAVVNAVYENHSNALAVLINLPINYRLLLGSKDRGALMWLLNNNHITPNIAKVIALKHKSKLLKEVALAAGADTCIV